MESAFNKIQSKHVDFVLCDPKTLVPVKVIELDDKSHDRTRSKANDSFKDELFKTVGIECIRIKAQARYESNELQRVLVPVVVEKF